MLRKSIIISIKGTKLTKDEKDILQAKEVMDQVSSVPFKELPGASGISKET